MTRSSEQFVRALVAAVPDLAALCSEHIDDNYGELLPHVFMGDVTRYVIDSVKDPFKQGYVQGILDQLNDVLENGKNEVQELVYVSFLENLLGESEAQELLIPLMKPTIASVSRDFWM